MGVSSGINLLGPTRNHKHPPGEGQRGLATEKKERDTGARCCVADFEDGTRSHEPQNTAPEAGEEARKQIPPPPPAASRGSTALGTLGF